MNFFIFAPKCKSAGPLHCGGSVKLNGILVGAKSAFRRDNGGGFRQDAHSGEARYALRPLIAPIVSQNLLECCFAQQPGE